MKPSRADRILKRVEPYLTPGQLAALREVAEYELEEARNDGFYSGHESGYQQGKDEAESGGES